MLTLALLVVGACAQQGAAEPEVRDEELPMKISVSLRGDFEVTVTDRTVPTKYFLIGEGHSAVRPTFGVQPIDPLVEGNVAVLPGVSIKPFEGDGRYTIEPGSPYDLHKDGAPKDGKAPQVESAVRIEWWPSDREPEEYLRRGKPCRVDVADNGMKGRLQCPEMVGESNGYKFSVDFRWEKA